GANPVIAAPTLASYLAAAFPPPAVTVAVIANAAEPGTPGTIRFTRTGGDQTQALTVNYTVGGTATPGVDYLPLSGTVTFLAGQPTANVTITPIDDTQPEPTETVSVTVAAGTGYTGVGNAATASLIDNDSAVGTVTVAAVTNAAEPNTAGTFRFTRVGGDLTQPLIVSYTVAGTATPAVDYAALPGTVTIPAGQTTVDVPVTVIDDTAV